MKIFISYGRDNYAFVVERVAKELCDEFGADNVLFDKQLKPSGNFDDSLQDMLTAADVVVLFMTPHSVRKKESVCLDEIAFARGNRTPILPVMLVDCTPPLLVSRIQWLDFRDCFADKDIVEENYKRAFLQLVQVLKGERELDHQGAQNEIIKLLEPFDFGAQIANSAKKYVPRRQMQQKVKCWICDGGQSFFWLTGNPGTGKSSFSSWCTLENDEAVGAHFCSYYLPQTCDAKRLFKHLAYHLCMQSPEYEEYILNNIDFHKLNDSSVSEVFFTLFVKAAGAITAHRNMLLVIDGIDEMDAAVIKDMSAALFNNRLYIPRWLKFFMTSRPDPTLTGQLSFIKPTSFCDDIEDYIQSEAERRGLVLSDDVVHTLHEHSGGSFLYISGVLDDLVRDGEGCLEHLPSGMGAVFTKYFDRQSLKFMAPETTKTLLQVMCAAKEPLPATTLANIIGVSEYILHQVVGEFGAFIVSDGGLRFYHKQLKDWLVDESNAHYWVSVADGNKLISDWIAQNADDFIFDDYMLKYGFLHLLEEKRYDAVHDILAENDKLAENAFLYSILSLAADGKFTVIFKAVKFLCANYSESQFPLRRTIKHMMENGCYDKCEQYMKSVFRSHSTEWINNYALLIHKRVSGNIAEVRELCNQSWDDAPEDVRADIEFYLGEACRENGSMEIACGHYKKAIELAARFPDNSANYLSRLKLIDIAYVEGNIDFALAELQKLKVGESLRQANYLKKRLMGHVKEAMGRFDEAKEFYLQSLDIAKDIKKNYLVMESFNSIGGVCTDIDEGFMYLANGRKIAQANNYRLEYGKNLTFTARLFLMANKPLEAADAAREAETCLLEVGYMPGAAAAKLHYAVALYRLNNLSAAKQLLEESNEIYNRENIYPHLHLAAIEWLIRVNQRLCCYSPVDTDVEKLLEANKDLEYMNKTADSVRRGVVANAVMSEFVKGYNSGAYSIGYHNKNYVVEASGKKYVVREPVEDFEVVDIRVNDENDMLVYASKNLPYLHTPEYIGSAYMGDVLCAIHGFVDGKALGAIYGDLDKIDDRLVDVLAEQIARMHLEPVPQSLASGLSYGNVREFYSYEKGFLQRLIQKWYSLMKPFYDSLGLPDVEVMLNDGQNVLTERPFALCHCDIHRGNLLWDETSGVMHFIDWELTQIADPVYDIAIHFHKIHYTEAQERRFLELYKASTGFDIPDLEKQIDFYRKAEEVKSNIIDGIRCIMEIPRTYDRAAQRFAERYLFKLKYLSKRFGFKLNVDSAEHLHNILCENKAKVAQLVGDKA